ncbi:carotenoid oxygenase family protein [Streptosporangium sp. NPDC004631]
MFNEDRLGRAGRLLSIVTGHSGNGSRPLVLDAAALDLVASVRLPRRVPSGFHGSRMPGH